MAAILAAAGVSVAAASCSSSSAGAPATPTSDGGTDASAEALPDYRSGTRLRARLLTAEGGSALFKGWHDKDLDFDCAFGPAEDSMTRCLPQSRSLNDFADAACANRVVAASPGCVPPKFVSALGTCSTGAPVFRVGAKLAAATIYTKGTDGSCTASPPTTSDIYAVGEAVPASAFVAATSVQQARGARLAMSYLKADDGAVQAISPYDVSRKAACAVTSTLATRCVPTGLAFEEQLYADSTCQAQAALRTSTSYDCSLPPTVVLLYDPAAKSCFTDPGSFAEVGAKLNGPIYRQNGSTCTATSTSVGDTFYAVGAAIPNEAFAPVVNADVGAPRVKVRTLMTESGERLVARVLVDTERNEECRPTLASDHVMRCMFPSDYSVTVQYFSDMGCVSPIATGTPACGTPAFVQLATNVAGPACGESTTTQVFKVGAKITPTMIYSRTTGGCRVLAPPPSTDFYEATTEVPASAFATVRTVFE